MKTPENPSLTVLEQWLEKCPFGKGEVCDVRMAGIIEYDGESPPGDRLFPHIVGE